jgi:hypothetical protein
MPTTKFWVGFTLFVLVLLDHVALLVTGVTVEKTPLLMGFQVLLVGGALGYILYPTRR